MTIELKQEKMSTQAKKTVIGRQNGWFWKYSFLIITTFSFYYCQPLGSQEDRSRYLRRYEKIVMKADSLFTPLIFEGVVTNSYLTTCAGGKNPCTKVEFSIDENILNDPNFIRIDYGFVKIMGKDSNVIILSSSPVPVGEGDEGAKTRVEIQIGDKIIKRKGTPLFVLQSKTWNEEYLLSPLSKMEGSYEANDSLYRWILSH